MTRIVVRAPNWLGDILMAVPAITAVRAAYPTAHLAIAAPAAFADVCATIPGVDGVVPLPGGGLRAIGPHAQALKAGGFDLAILFTNSFATALAASRAGIAERWGYRRDLRGRLLTRAVPVRSRKTTPESTSARTTPESRSTPESISPRTTPESNFTPESFASSPPESSSRHHSAYYLRLVARLGMPPVATAVVLAPPPAAVGRAAALLTEAGVGASTRLVGFAPGAAYGSAKRWPPERVAAAITGVTRGDIRAVLVGAAADREIAAAIRSALDPATRAAVVDLVGRTDVATLMAVLARCAVVVANDSGAMHVASAVGRPVVAIFGPTDERATAPLGPHTLVRHEVWCRPCLLRACPIDHRCLQGVAPETVVAAVSQYGTAAP
jgi:heptosyltransferase-2